MRELPIRERWKSVKLLRALFKFLILAAVLSAIVVVGLRTCSVEHRQDWSKAQLQEYCLLIDADWDAGASRCNNQKLRKILEKVSNDEHADKRLHTLGIPLEKIIANPTERSWALLTRSQERDELARRLAQHGADSSKLKACRVTLSHDVKEIIGNEILSACIYYLYPKKQELISIVQ